MDQEMKWRKLALNRAKAAYRKQMKKLKGKSKGKSPRLTGKKKAQLEALEAQDPLAAAGLATEDTWLEGLQAAVRGRRDARWAGRKSRSRLTPAVRAAADSMASG